MYVCDMWQLFQVIFVHLLFFVIALLCHFRQYLEQNQGKGGGGGVITSEALQPIYELKHVAERSSKSSEEVLAKLSTVCNTSLGIIWNLFLLTS